MNIPLGFAFLLIITRSLETIEYGTWGLISNFIVYAVIIEYMISYWVVREIARDKDSGRTAISSGIILSLGGIIIYLIVAFLVGEKTDSNFETILLGICLLPLLFVSKVLQGITSGWRPQGVAYGQILFGITQIPVGLVLIHFLQLGTLGIIFSVMIAYSISIIFFLIYNRKKFTGKIKIEFVKKWLRFSWIPLYPAIAGMILFFDVSIFAVITGSVIGIAFWIAAWSLATVIESSGLISKAVYSKLLQNKKENFVSENIRQLFYFSIFITSLVIVFAKPGLFALNPEYVKAEYIVIILALQFFLRTITENLQKFIIGIEKIDEEDNPTFKEMMKSKLFKIPTITFVQSISYIVSLTIILIILVSIITSQLELIFYWACVGLIIQIPISAYTTKLFKNNFSSKVNLIEITKYLISAFISSITLILIDKFVVYHTKVFDFLPQILILIFLNGMIYFGITLGIDKKN